MSYKQTPHFMRYAVQVYSGSFGRDAEDEHSAEFMKKSDEALFAVFILYTGGKCHEKATA